MDVALSGYERVGERAPPKSAHVMSMGDDGVLSKGGNVPAFKTLAIAGSVEVTLQYFADPACSVPKRASKAW
jgi:hypothetical protein